MASLRYECRKRDSTISEKKVATGGDVKSLSTSKFQEKIM